MIIKHTPAPWDVFGAQDASSDKWRALTVSQASMPFMRVCFMPSDGTETIMADANLIAAAPTMLAKLQQIAMECCECDGAAKIDGDPCPICKDIRDLIATATGEK